MKNIFKLLLMCSFLFAKESLAFDASQSATEIRENGYWLVIEFSAPRQIIYRVSSRSINSNSHYLTFDFVPSNKCVPDPAVMVLELRSYINSFDNGILPMSYKLPGGNEFTEIVKTHMSQGDKFAYFQFKKLRVDLLLKSHDKGKLSTWIPGSGDGTVKRSENIYFSLDGLSKSFNEASELCNDNR